MMKIRAASTLLFFFLIPLFFSVFCSAATVQITDTLLNPDNGGLAAGYLTIQNPPFTDDEGNRIAGRKLRYRVTNGVVSFTLESTTDALSPSSGLYYTTLYQMDDGRSYTEYWVLPPTPSPTDIASMVTDPQPTPGVTVSTSVLSQSGAVVGECLVWSGSAWQPESCSAGSGVIPCVAPFTELTISSGAITIASSACYAVDTEANAGSDDLTAITCSAGQFFILVPADNARTVVVKAVVGIVQDFTLDNVLDSIYFRCSSANVVSEITRHSGGP